jgi:hypothetical protein
MFEAQWAREIIFSFIFRSPRQSWLEAEALCAGKFPQTTEQQMQSQELSQAVSRQEPATEIEQH